jgi:hypothetical protein
MDRINETKGESRFFCACQLFYHCKTPSPQHRLKCYLSFLLFNFSSSCNAVKGFASSIVGGRKGDEAGNKKLDGKIARLFLLIVHDGYTSNPIGVSVICFLPRQVGAKHCSAGWGKEG